MRRFSTGKEALLVDLFGRAQDKPDYSPTNEGHGHHEGAYIPILFRWSCQPKRLQLLPLCQV